ncbi:hypothetical protein E2C01_001689 [Portunus trituberculatus]|uniref:Uncharacterized protein n=1 Tax=Portunus trituberculatus TaxID=210409 RepID=A0A5B7CL14_PORTR|nr:hypothetical protein [Portunus trituberculatus]
MVECAASPMHLWRRGDVDAARSSGGKALRHVLAASQQPRAIWRRGGDTEAGGAAWRERGAAIKCLKSLTKDAEGRYEAVSCPPVRSQLEGGRKELRQLSSIFVFLT